MTLGAHLFAQHLVLGAQVLDRRQLATLEPTRDRQHEEVECGRLHDVPSYHDSRPTWNLPKESAIWIDPVSAHYGMKTWFLMRHTTGTHTTPRAPTRDRLHTGRRRPDLSMRAASSTSGPRVDKTRGPNLSVARC